MGGIHQAVLLGPFEQIKHRRPLLAGALHGPVGEPRLGQPMGQRQLVDRHGPTFLEPHGAVGLLPGGPRRDPAAVIIFL
jgi:hypothetical protein